MSWLSPKRPKKSHPFPPNDRRVLPQNFTGRGAMLKAVFWQETQRHVREALIGQSLECAK